MMEKGSCMKQIKKFRKKNCNLKVCRLTYILNRQRESRRTETTTPARATVPAGFPVTGPDDGGMLLPCVCINYFELENMGAVVLE